jgi:biopolymer transport protein ExbD
MNLRRRHKESAEVSTESLNDIMFFLLLFFLILSTLVNPSVIKVNLPSAEQHQSIDIKPIPLAITADRKYYLNNHEVQLADLESAILNETKGIKEPALLLQFDSKLTVQDIVDIMQIGAKLKVKMVLSTKQPNA